MNIIAGNITFKGNVKIPKSFDFDVIETLSKTGDKNIYIFGETEIKTSKDFGNMCKKEIGEIIDLDISIQGENRVELLPYDYEEEIYEVVSFEGEDVEFNDILEKFKNSESIFSVREAGISKKFGNKIIKADFIY